MFCSFLNFKFFSIVKLSRKLQKNYFRSFQVKGHQRVPVADQGGPPPSQKARWRGPAPWPRHPPSWVGPRPLGGISPLTLSLSARKLEFFLWFSRSCCS